MNENTFSSPTPRVIALAVTGSIAAYKAPELVRRFIKAGCDVHVILTKNAERFVSSEALAIVSKHSVVRHDGDTIAGGMQHIDIARRIDALVIAPATADTIARLAAGRSDDIIGAIKLAASAQVFIAPAMNQQMWVDTITTSNINRLRDSGCTIIQPDSGEQACGDVGPGRLADIDAIVRAVLTPANAPLHGRRVLMTVGPTREAIDAVRFLSNNSSGKMGYALAAALQRLGAEVTAVSGPVHIEAPVGCQVRPVISAAEMLAAVQHELQARPYDIFIGAAAVCDYAPAQPQPHKMKKPPAGEQVTMTFVTTPDILHHVATGTPRPSLVIGFCAETEHLLANALAKRQRKGCDIMLANSVGGDTGFYSDDNEITWIDQHGALPLARAPKITLAHTIAQKIAASVVNASTSTAAAPVAA